ncbi:MAG TPA: hypothetical protein VFU46_11020, partial [Gemmatimonadales bacterium]|nr:hypothetical protein [Gemmatimonadales bacterium]
MTAALPSPTIREHWRIRGVAGRAGERAFAEAARRVYARDPQWTPPLPGELRDMFDPDSNPPLRAMRWCRWLLADGDRACGRVAAFAPAARPEVGYFGFFECPDDAGIARALLG